MILLAVFFSLGAVFGYCVGGLIATRHYLKELHELQSESIRLRYEQDAFHEEMRTAIEAKWRAK